MKLKLSKLGLALALVGGCFPCAAQDSVLSESTTVAIDLVEISGFEVEGNTLLPNEEVALILKRYSGSMSLGAVNEAALALQTRYRDLGYGTVVVTIPPQTIVDRKVKLLVVEGRLTNVQTAGVNALSEDNVLRALPSLIKGQPVNFQDLDSQLLMINESPVKNVRVVFQPGVKPKEVDALVVVQEMPVSQIKLSVDNTGTKSTGRDRVNLNYRNGNLFDGDVVANLRYTTSFSKPSQVSLFSGSVRVPLYGPRLFIEGFARYSSTENTPNQTPAGELTFAGKGQSIGLRALKIIDSKSEIKHQVYVGAERREFDNTCSLGNFGSAGCGSLGLDLDVQPVSLGYIAQKQGSFIASAQVVHNLSGGANGNQQRFDAIRLGSEANYTKLQVNGQGVANLADGLGARWRFDSQLTGEPLVASEQFGLGGAYGVRGYEERELAGDSGFSFALEVSYALAQWIDLPDGLKSTELFGFLDGGLVKNKQSVSCDSKSSSCHLWSAGAGMRISPFKGWFAQAAVGVAGADAIDTERGDSRAHLNISYEF